MSGIEFQIKVLGQNLGQNKENHFLSMFLLNLIFHELPIRILLVGFVLEFSTY